MSIEEAVGVVRRGPGRPRKVAAEVVAEDSVQVAQNTVSVPSPDTQKRNVLYPGAKTPLLKYLCNKCKRSKEVRSDEVVPYLCAHCMEKMRVRVIG